MSCDFDLIPAGRANRGSLGASSVPVLTHTLEAGAGIATRPAIALRALSTSPMILRSVTVSQERCFTFSAHGIERSGFVQRPLPVCSWTPRKRGPFSLA